MYPKINVNIQENRSISYDIDISSTFIDSVIKKYQSSNAFFIIDKEVYNIYKEIMPQEKFYLFEASEDNKSLASAEKILFWLKNNAAIRDSEIIAIGGGITGDISAFVASIYMRGIKVTQIPTTLLSMVDSSVGGKCGVNFQGIKNNIGSFLQPSKVYIDIDFLNSLSYGEFLNGLAESIKIALIADKSLYSFINDNVDKLIQRDKQVLLKIISTSCSLKAQIVEEDEHEAGIRKLLNFGHTIGHAIETDSNYTIKHGFAVILGVVYELKLSKKFGLINECSYNLVIDTLNKLGYSVSYDVCDMQKFINAVASDKKATRNGIIVALTTDEMKGTLRNVSVEDIIAVL